jgi:hypothetical protein
MGKPDTGAKRSFLRRVKPKIHQLPYFEFGFGPENYFHPYQRAALVGPTVDIP